MIFRLRVLRIRLEGRYFTRSFFEVGSKVAFSSLARSFFEVHNQLRVESLKRTFGRRHHHVNGVKKKKPPEGFETNNYNVPTT